jgi:hypothetical protein
LVGWVEVVICWVVVASDLGDGWLDVPGRCSVVVFDIVRGGSTFASVILNPRELGRTCVSLRLGEGVFCRPEAGYV